MVKLSPVTVNEMELFEVKKLGEFMELIGRKEEWDNWFCGQTGMIVGIDFYVYASDVYRFFEGQSAIVT